MSQRRSGQTDSETMDDDQPERESRQMQMGRSSEAASSSASALICTSASADARAQLMAGRAQRRGDAERDASERETRRMDSLITKVATREARQEAKLASEQWRGFSPAQRMFADGVALCLGFLSFRNFNSAARTCKQWRSGALKVKSLGSVTVGVRSAAGVESLRTSPFRALITALTDFAFVPPDCFCAHCAEPISGRSSLALFNALRSLSNLQSVDLPVDLSTLVDSTPMRYPAQLSTVSFVVGCSNWSVETADNASWVLHGLDTCPSLTRLKMNLFEVPIVLTSLGALKQLRHLLIDGFVESHYSVATLHAIKMLPLLETLALNHTEDRLFNEEGDEFNSEWLTPLLTAPHQLQKLQSLNRNDFCLWDSTLVLELLPSLQSLTMLHSNCASVLALPVLAAFTRLRVLDLSFDETDFELHEDNEEVAAAYDDNGCARLSVIVPHLAHCSLTELSLKSMTCDNASLATLCQSQQRLEILSLHYAALTTVEPLGTLLLLSQLTLELASHSDELPELFDHISQCKALREVQLKRIAPALSEAQQQQLQPPSTLLPCLRKFNYSNR